MESSERVLEACMSCPGIHNGGQAELVDTVKTLKKRMLYDVIQQSSFNFYKPENGITNYFMFVHINIVALTIGKPQWLR